ncbi:MAG TPA: hypothetical protein VF483_12680 [Gemmatimonadaceae bacterium]
MPTLRVALLVALALPQAVPAQWVYTNTGASELRGLSVADKNTIWASGARGWFVLSTDGGFVWKADTVRGATGLDFRSISAINNRVAFIASAGEAEKGQATIMSTGSSGASWAQEYATRDTGVFIDALESWNPRNWVALSDPTKGAFTLIMSSDGKTWRRLPPDNLPRVLPGEAAFAASGTSLVVRGKSEMWIGTGGGGKARVMHSPDAGATWSVAETPVHADGASSGIFGLAFFDSVRGVAVGGDYLKRTLAAVSVALTTDGGKTWRAAKAPPAAFLSGVAYAGSPAKLVAVGLAGTFTSADSGDTWTQVDSIALNPVKVLGANGWAVGPRGRVARWNAKSP